MPTQVELNGFIDTFRTLAGVCFTLGVTVAMGYIGWQIAKSYFFSGAGDREPPIIHATAEQEREILEEMAHTRRYESPKEWYEAHHDSDGRELYRKDDIPY